MFLQNRKCPLGRFSWRPDLQLSLSCDLDNVFSIGRHSATKASTASPTHCHGATLSLWSTPMTPTQTCFRSVSAHTYTHTQHAHAHVPCQLNILAAWLPVGHSLKVKKEACWLYMCNIQGHQQRGVLCYRSSLQSFCGHVDTTGVGEVYTGKANLDNYHI